jgi:hypothetical protein
MIVCTTAVRPAARFRAHRAFGDRPVGIGCAIERTAKIKEAAVGEMTRVFAGLGTTILIDDGQRQVFDIERQSEAEQQHQYHRNHKAKQQQQLIPADFCPFLSGENRDAAQVHGSGRAGTLSPFCGWGAASRRVTV